MKQKILHCSNTENLPNQLIEAGFFYDENGEASFILARRS